MRLMWQAVIFATLLVITAPMQASAEDAETAPTGGTLTMEPNINLFGGDYATSNLPRRFPNCAGPPAPPTDGASPIATSIRVHSFPRPIAGSNRRFLRGR